MPSKKHILIIGPGMEIGGVERSLLGLLDALNYDKYEVDLFLRSHSGELMSLINPKANLLPEEPLYALAAKPIATLFKTGHWYVGAIRLLSKVQADSAAKKACTVSVNTHLCNRRLTSRIKPLETNYDLALGFFLPFYQLNTKVKAKVKIGWVHTDYSNPNERLNLDFYREMWGNLDYIACVSDDVKKSFVEVYPEFADKMIVIENILSKQLIRTQSREREVLSEMPRDSSFRILSVGRFCAAKAFDEAIRACMVLRNKGLNIKWYFIGYGPDEDMLSSLISELHLEDCAIILGKRTNPYPYMKECDLYVQPSRYEGKAVTVREAQMLGKPVLITNYSTASAQLRDGVDGFICEMGSEGIADGIECLYKNQGLRDRLAKNCTEMDYSNVTEVDKIYALMNAINDESFDRCPQ